MEGFTDVTIGDHGSIILFRLRTAAAREWVEENVHKALWFGAVGVRLAVEPRRASELSQRMDEAGLHLGTE